MRLTKPLPRQKEKIKQEIEMLTNKPSFTFKVDQIRIKFNIDTTLRNDEEFIEKYNKDWVRYYEDMTNNQNFRDDLILIMKENKLHMGWLEFLEEYVLLNEKNYQDPNAPVLEIGVETLADHITGEPTYNIRFYPMTTQAEIKRAWKSIKPSDVKNRRSKLWKTFDRDKDIAYLYYDKHKKYKEIYDFIYKKYKHQLDPGNMRRILTRYKEKIN